MAQVIVFLPIHNLHDDYKRENSKEADCRIYPNVACSLWFAIGINRPKDETEEREKASDRLHGIASRIFVLFGLLRIGIPRSARLAFNEHHAGNAGEWQPFFHAVMPSWLSRP